MSTTRLPAGVGGSKLVVNNGLLSVQDVPRAGKYEWKVDLRPDDEKQAKDIVDAAIDERVTLLQLVLVVDRPHLQAVAHGVVVEGNLVGAHAPTLPLPL